MNDEWKAKWVAALTSGKYKQTKGTLTDKNGFCCLGVLCDIHPDVEWSERLNEKDHRFAEMGKGTCTRTTLPRPLKESLSIHDYECGHLMQLNDAGASFDFIATHIQEKM
jgi:hypothetical protein